jgi:hypothetical protein
VFMVHANLPGGTRKKKERRRDKCNLWQLIS